MGWGMGNQSLYVEMENFFSLCQYVPAKRHFLFTFYCCLLREACLKDSQCSRALCCLIIQSCWCADQSSFNTAFSNSKEFSSVYSSRSFPFIWRVNVCLFSRPVGREIYRLYCLSSTETKWWDLRSAFHLRFEKIWLVKYGYDILVWLLLHIIVNALLESTVWTAHKRSSCMRKKKYPKKVQVGFRIEISHFLIFYFFKAFLFRYGR